MEKNYQSFVENRIFMGGASDVEDMVKNEQVEVIVDLREESKGCAYPSPNVKWIHVPIGDNSETPQETLFKEAIDHVVKAHNQGKKVGFHCGGGKGRTGAVAIGTLIALGKVKTINEAEKMAKSIRPIINIREPQRVALEKIYDK
jgi:protein-tyrosine phosphatase